jgi:hypothetical protein
VLPFHGCSSEADADLRARDGRCSSRSSRLASLGEDDCFQRKLDLSSTSHDHRWVLAVLTYLRGSRPTA